MRFFSFGAVLAAIASAFWLYTVNLETRRLEAEVMAREKAAETARSDIAVLKAERAYLARPERIEPMARALGLRPAEPRQMIGPETLAATAGLIVGATASTPARRQP